MGIEFENLRRKLISRMGNYTNNTKTLFKFEKDLDRLIELNKDQHADEGEPSKDFVKKMEKASEMPGIQEFVKEGRKIFGLDADKNKLCKCGHLYLFHKPKCCGDPVKCRCEKFESLAESVQGGKDGNI